LKVKYFKYKGIIFISLIIIFVTIILLNMGGSTVNSMIAYWNFDERSGKEVEEGISGKKSLVNYVFNDAKYKTSIDPEWRKNGIENGALLFDGYSTFIEYDNNEIQLPKEDMTVSVWVAPRAFEYGDKGQLSSFINSVDKTTKSGFELGMYRHGSFAFGVGLGESFIQVWNDNNNLEETVIKKEDSSNLEKYQWTQVVGVYSCKEGYLKLYKNGELVGEQTLSDKFKGLTIKNPNEKLIIGKNNDATALSVFSGNMFNGLMDEVKIYDNALSDKEIKKQFENTLAAHNGKIPEIIWDDIKLDNTILQDDIYRPQYHAIAPEHWMNEPHAPLYYNGKYHLFYQHNPFGPFWHQIHWGHWVSDDMVHWEFVKDALSPENDNVAPDGIWSGSASYDENGVPVLFFTAGNDSNKPNQSVGMATPVDINDPYLEEWIKYPQSIVEQAKGIGDFGEFRDPFVWKDEKENKWYMLVGSGTDNNSGGTALFYVSTDMINWEYKGPFYVSNYDKYPYLGERWELPVLLPVKDAEGREKDIFLVLPHGDGADIDVYYWLGKFDKETYSFIPEDETPKLIDFGDFMFTGQSGFVDPKTNRTILFTIAQGDRTSWDEYYSGWAHNAGLPLELTIDKNGNLSIAPIKELESLRKGELVSFQDKTIKESNELIKNIKGDMLEISVTFENVSADNVGIFLRQSKEKEEETKVYYDISKKGLYINRLKSSLGTTGKGVKGGELKLEDGELTLHIYLDRSMIEIYANNKNSITSRAYPILKDALGIEVFGGEETTVKNMKVWEMGTAY
jgi:sucrose-6-phosphate hydrolase SacC (GH32 family)